MLELNNFEQIDINSFFDADTSSEESQKIEVLTKKQRSLINETMPIVTALDPERAKIFKNRIEDLEALGKAIARFPSLLERHELAGGTRTPTSLIDSLIDHQDQGDSTLRLPSKAILGKGLLVSKTHTFSSIYKYIKHHEEHKKLAKALEAETLSSMFSLLVEDVYLNLIRDTSQPIEFRREWALSLLLLWEHWNDQTSEDVAPVLQSVWKARRKLAPAFGTMMGTSELLLISMQMDDQWIAFIKQKMGADPASVAFDTLSSAVANNADVVIIDTAGRLHNKIGLMNELTKIKNVMQKVVADAPHEVLLVLDGSTGQNAFEQAKQFTKATEVTAMAITKLDGTAKGGVVIGISDQFKIPVKYIGLGEGIDHLQVFRRKEFVDSLFGETDK